jgi:pimeloyl-ACP methyl ester carboxylesterase
MAAFVLIHGGCCGGADWQAVASLLEERGHRVAAPDLPGMGADRTPLREVSLESWAHFTANLVRRQSEPAILVGHSRGGIVISQAAEYAPTYVATLVYVAAMLVPNGSSQGEVSAHLPRDIDFFAVSDDGAALLPFAEKAREIVFNRTPPDVAARAIARFCPEPAACFHWRLQLTEENFGSIPRAYIETAHDNAIPLELQRLMQRTLPCSTVITMQTDHSPAHSAPSELASHLHLIAEQAVGRLPGDL